MKQETPFLQAEFNPEKMGHLTNLCTSLKNFEEQLSIKFQNSELDMRTQHNSNIGTLTMTDMKHWTHFVNCTISKLQYSILNIDSVGAYNYGLRVSMPFLIFTGFLSEHV